MVAQGLKRKLQERDEGGSTGWENQLQSVLDISLDKFQRDQALVEPSLLRSVLINNTLRQVQSEVRTSLSAAGGPQKPQASLRVQPEREGTPVGLGASICSQAMEDMENDFMPWSTEEDISLSSAISAILKNLDAALDGGYAPPVPQCSPLSSVENIMGGDRKFIQSLTFSHKVESCRASEAGTSGFLQDATIDDLLLDIDTSVLDGDVNRFSPHAFSFSSEEFVKYLPSVSGSSSMLSSSGSREMQELEHIMDILVRS